LQFKINIATEFTFLPAIYKPDSWGNAPLAITLLDWLFDQKIRTNKATVTSNMAQQRKTSQAGQL
jgi:hypothetical protein